MCSCRYFTQNLVRSRCSADIFVEWRAAFSSVETTSTSPPALLLVLICRSYGHSGNLCRSVPAERRRASPTRIGFESGGEQLSAFAFMYPLSSWGTHHIPVGTWSCCGRCAAYFRTSVVPHCTLCCRRRPTFVYANLSWCSYAFDWPGKEGPCFGSLGLFFQTILRLHTRYTHTYYNTYEFPRNCFEHRQYTCDSTPLFRGAACTCAEKGQR